MRKEDKCGYCINFSTQKLLMEIVFSHILPLNARGKYRIFANPTLFKQNLAENWFLLEIDDTGCKTIKLRKS